MSLILGCALTGAGLALVAGVAHLEQRRIRSTRRKLLDACRPLFEEARLEHGGDGFPRLYGRIGGSRVTIELIPDMMTIRRLPQLWMSVTLLEPVPVESGLAVLVRPSGAEFFSLTQHFHATLRVPNGFPEASLVRGQSPGATKVLATVAPAVATLLADPKVKEVAVTPNGVRAIRQVAEGRRGDYLLLRQSAFDVVSVDPGAMLELVDSLFSLRAALVPGKSAKPTPDQPSVPPRESRP
jgi:hypothetical protein